MKIKLSLIILVVLSTSCGKLFHKKAKVQTLTQQQKLSYAIGSMVGNDLKNNGVDTIDPVYFSKALDVVFKGDSAILSETEIREALQIFSDQLRAKQEAKRAAETVLLTAEGKTFLEQNKTKEGVVTTPSGLQYKILKPGTGAYPAGADNVTVHYEGKLLNGNIFDSSFERGQPIDFGLNQVIPGWTEGMQHINEGGEIELYIPYNLGYGEQGAGGAIPPYATLIFKVQLIKINKELPQGHSEHDGHNH